MAAVAIDSLEYAHQLEAVGMLREQAEAVARGLTTMFIHNFDSLVTKDYLDTRFSEFETRVEANMDRRFTDVNKIILGLEAGMDKKLLGFEARVDKQLLALEAKVDSRFSKIYLMFGLTFTTATIPVLQNIFS